jgi:hypothetical protein
MAAVTGHFVTVAVAEESAYGSLSNGVPDASGLTFTSIDCLATLRTLNADAPVDDDTGTRDGSWRRAPRPNAAYDISNSRWRQRMEGSFTVEGWVDPIGSGSGITNYDAHPLGIMVGTILAKLADPVSASETVAGSSGANILTATASTLYTEGAIIGHTLNGAARFAQVTDKSGADITHSPALNPAGLAITNTVRFYRTYYAPKPGQATDVESFAIRLDSAGTRFYATGCVVESVAFTETDGGQLRYSISVQTPCIYTDHGGASLDPPDFAGEIYAHRFNAPLAYSDSAAGVTAPYTLGSEDVEAVPGSVQTTITATLAQTGIMGDGLPYKLKPVGLDFESTFVADDPPSTLVSDFESRTHRSWVIGYGPQAGGAGVVMLYPRAHLMLPAGNRDNPEGGVIQQTITVRPGEPHAVNDTSNVADAPFLLGFGL